MSSLCGCGPHEETIGIKLANRDGYAYLDLYQSHTCLVVEGTFNKVTLNQNSFTINDGNKRYSCNRLDINNNSFAAYFDIEGIKDNQDVVYKTFVPTLTYNGKTYDDSEFGYINSKYSPTVSYMNHLRITKNKDNNIEIISYIDTNIEISSSEDFASISKEDNNYFFTVKGDYTLVDGVSINKEAFKIMGDHLNDEYSCIDLITNNNKFTAKFVVNDLFNRLKSGVNKVTFYPHLYFLDERFDKGSGDIICDSSLSLTKVEKDNKKMTVSYNEDKKVVINIEWKEA